MHDAPQAMNPGRQAQLPALQYWLCAQVRVQSPQWSGSFCKSKHWLLQLLRSQPHIGSHASAPPPPPVDIELVVAEVLVAPPDPPVLPPSGPPGKSAIVPSVQP